MVQASKCHTWFMVMSNQSEDDEDRMLSFLCVLLACNVITSADMDSGTASSPLSSDDWTSPAGDSPNLPTYCRLCTFSTEPVLQGIVQIFQPTSLQACTFSTEPVLQGIIQIIQPTSLDALHFVLYICTTITLPKNCASLFALPVVLVCGLIVLMVLVLVLVYGTICL